MDDARPISSPPAATAAAGASATPLPIPIDDALITSEDPDTHTPPPHTQPIDSSQSPQRPETEALTPEPDDLPPGSSTSQQGDVQFEDGDVDLLASVDRREGESHS